VGLQLVGVALEGRRERVSPRGRVLVLVHVQVLAFRQLAARRSAAESEERSVSETVVLKGESRQPRAGATLHRLGDRHPALVSDLVPRQVEPLQLRSSARQRRRKRGGAAVRDAVLLQREPAERHAAGAREPGKRTHRAVARAVLHRKERLECRQRRERRNHRGQAIGTEAAPMQVQLRQLRRPQRAHR